MAARRDDGDLDARRPVRRRDDGRRPEVLSLVDVDDLARAQGGERFVEAYFIGSSADQPANLKSVTKSLLATLVGVAIDRAWIASVEDPIGLYLPSRFADDDPNAEITVRELLTMTSGLPAVPNGHIQTRDDWVATVLAETRRTDVDNLCKALARPMPAPALAAHGWRWPTWPFGSWPG